jgi:hypothetical protein
MLALRISRGGRTGSEGEDEDYEEDSREVQESMVIEPSPMQSTLSVHDIAG